jgi:hypothetical protein
LIIHINSQVFAWRLTKIARRVPLKEGVGEMASYIPGKNEQENSLTTSELFALTGTIICAFLSVSILIYRLLKNGV